jgi:hypothetical protein
LYFGAACDANTAETAHVASPAPSTHVQNPRLWLNHGPLRRIKAPRVCAARSTMPSVNSMPSHPRHAHGITAGTDRCGKLSRLPFIGVVVNDAAAAAKPTRGLIRASVKVFQSASLKRSGAPEEGACAGVCLRIGKWRCSDEERSHSGCYYFQHRELLVSPLAKIAGHSGTTCKSNKDCMLASPSQ